ncbi:coatomer WD associated region-domain-containing protein [Polychytrium aggregatum]|uniref:coatomer WD associated region-domain-containing protein n=1 Tax=Polychytrium aggregatum TaxID=110093 RepID=UPI0022FF2D0D|nr:coatomer WD associated region-domain-containing protein [Polychytrium aggregatum]KAI9208226.1 coatomer WD associated region-domain-containing protein [Polychytrium aggregatum]
MPLRLEIKRKLSNRSERVKALDYHPTEPWLLTALYNGNVYIWNHETQTIVKTFETTDLPVRAAKFIPRKSWLVTGSDDMQIRVFNYNTHEKVTTFEAHSDYIRSIAVHPTQPYILTSSDDMSIKLWDWDKGWKNLMVFEGHTHFVMHVVFNPKDGNTFASACLDSTIKVWSLGSNVANYTLKGHSQGVNCVDYYHGGDKPYLVSGADDKLVKIWDYQNKTCVQTLEGHTQNVIAVGFHPNLPIILSGSEDGTVRIWHANTYRLENTLNYTMERVWAIAYTKQSNDVAFGYDEGTIAIKLGREEPVISMDSSGKIIWAKHSEIQTANVKSVAEEGTKDGDRIVLSSKDLGSCEVYPQTLQHSPNGRFVVVCGDGEYIIYTALAWRNKSFGSALEFVWALDSNEYAVRETSSKVKLFKNFKEKNVQIKLSYSAEGIFGGVLLGIRSSTFLSFYDWETGVCVRRVDIVAKSVFWSESDLVAIACEDTTYILKFNRVAYQQRLDQMSAADLTEEGIEDALELITEISECIKTGCWVGDCFIYTNSVNRLNYLVGGQTSTLSHFDSTMYILGYIPRDNRVYLTDKDQTVISYALPLSLIEYQTAILRGDYEHAESVLPNVPADQRNRIARFLEGQNLKEQALVVSIDPEHKFDLAIQLNHLNVAYEIALEVDQEDKWKTVGDCALAAWQFKLAEECLRRAKDIDGLLMFYQASGNASGLKYLAELAASKGRNNISFLCHLLLSEVEECAQILKATHRIPEAALMARTFTPSLISPMLSAWKASLVQEGKTKTAESLADPKDYPNLFPDIQYALVAEDAFMRRRERGRPSATEYNDWKDSLDWDVVGDTIPGRHPWLVSGL